ncbi:unnamed protein product [Ectocarpus sp. CCAP 1310/34]|nr:unnamed protein product [Ectocarpus sp. CCAP 1310/34]
MPSIAGFIQSLLSEDMYATGMLEKMDERISQLNAGQLRLLISFVENKVPGLTNPTVLDAYTKLLRKATVEREKRHEEEVHGERERLKQLKAAHAGVNAKAWDTSHASLDKELAKFQKFLKSKARRIAEEQVLQEEMEKLHNQLMALPARRAAAETKRHAWWACSAVLFAVVGPILILTLVPVGVLIAVGAFLATCVLAAVCWFVGVLRGIVVTPALDDDAIEDKTRKRAKETLKGYRADVRRTFEATEEIFAADMKWRDDWAEARKKERRNERRQAKEKALQEKEAAAATAAESRAQGDDRLFRAGNSRIFPDEEEEQGVHSDRCSSVGRAGPEAEEKNSGRVPPEEEGGGDKGHGIRPTAAVVLKTLPWTNQALVEARWGVLTQPQRWSKGGLLEKLAPNRVLGKDPRATAIVEGLWKQRHHREDRRVETRCCGGLEEEEEEEEEQQHNQVALPRAGFSSATSGGELSGGVVQETGWPSVGGNAAVANGAGTGGLNGIALSADDEGKGDMAV